MGFLFIFLEFFYWISNYVDELDHCKRFGNDLKRNTLTPSPPPPNQYHKKKRENCELNQRVGGTLFSIKPPPHDRFSLVSYRAAT